MAELWVEAARASHDAEHAAAGRSDLASQRGCPGSRSHGPVDRGGGAVAIANNYDASTAAAAAAAASSVGQALHSVGWRSVVAANNDGFRVGGILSASGFGISMAARVVAVEFTQGFGAMLGGAVVDLDGATLGDGGHKAGRSRLGLKWESEGEWQGAVGVAVICLLRTCIRGGGSAMSRILG